MMRFWDIVGTGDGENDFGNGVNTPETMGAVNKLYGEEVSG